MTEKWVHHQPNDGYTTISCNLTLVPGTGGTSKSIKLYSWNATPLKFESLQVGNGPNNNKATEKNDDEVKIT